VLVVPFYLMFHWLGLLDSILALVLVNAAMLLPLVTIIVRQTFLELPRELEEAAEVDGASPLRVFLRVVLPLAAPAIAAAGLIVFAFAWNEYLFTLAFFVLEVKTMPMSITSVAGTGAALMVRTLLAMSVPVILALLAQRYIVRGLTLGALKG
jgi:multiple sugar transport system permease protein